MQLSKVHVRVCIWGCFSNFNSNFLSDLTHLPPPEDQDDGTQNQSTPTSFNQPEIALQPSPEVLLDFASGFAMTSPPAEFGDAQAHDTSAESGDSLPSGLNDLPPSIRGIIDSMVENNQDGDDFATMAFIDSMILGEERSGNDLLIFLLRKIEFSAQAHTYSAVILSHLLPLRSRRSGARRERKGVGNRQRK